MLDEALVLSREVRACAASGSLAAAERLQRRVAGAGLDRRTVLGNLLVEMYGKCGSVERALAVFHRIARKNVFSWSIMMVAYAQNGHHLECVVLLRAMQLEGVAPNHVTLSIALKACCAMGNVAEGRMIHWWSRAHLDSEYVGNGLLVLYGSSGNVAAAERVLREMRHRDTASWTAMVAAYARNGHHVQALELVRAMVAEGLALDAHALVVMVDACALGGDAAEGRRIHTLAAAAELARRVPLANALVNMYAKCGCLDEAQHAFQQTTAKDVVSWTSMIVAYVQSCEPRAALELFQQMPVAPDDITYAAVLDACGTLGAARRARQIHARIVTEAADHRVSMMVASALIKLYGRLGCVEEAEAVLRSIRSPDVVAVSAMIGVYAQRADGPAALELFRSMQRDGHIPNAVTFLSALAACSHGGLLREACDFYCSAMPHDYGVEASDKHAVCMVEAVSKAGWLELAHDLSGDVRSPAARVVACSTLLAACKVHGDFRSALRAARLLDRLDPACAAHLVALSNACFSFGSNALVDAASAWEDLD